VISRASDMRFVCTLPATSCRTHLSVEPSAAPRVFLPRPLLLSALTTHARTGGGSSRACVLPAPVSTVTSDGVITAGGKHSAQSVERWTFCQYCYGFNFNTYRDMLHLNFVVILVLRTWYCCSRAHAACCLISAAHVRKTTSAQLQPRIASRWLAGPVAQLGWSITYTGCRK